MKDKSATADKAFSELIVKGPEEIQDHLSLVARTQVRIRALLQTSIEELERAQRLETLTSLIGGTGPGKTPPGQAHDSVPEGPEEEPRIYLEREIRTLKKMQRLLGASVRPLEEPAPPSAETGQNALVGGEAEDSTDAETPQKILLINHDLGTVRVLTYFLEKENYEVLTCSNGPDGLQKAVRDKPDIILLDVLLPGMDGYQVLNRLKKNEKTSTIPVFVLSVLAQEPDILKAIEGGAADYFTKPFSPPIIIAKIKRVRKARHE
jgi:CheY-like chemotaxis protein